MDKAREFKLLVSCCRSAFRDAGGRNIGEIAKAMDWPRFLRLARFHRVQGLAWKSLSAQPAVPEEIARALAKDALAIAASNLVATTEARDLMSDFDEAGVPILFLKGLPLGILAYGNPALKSGIDIDLLVDSSDLDTAGELLSRRGYALVVSKRSGRQSLGRWHAIRKESLWVDPRSGTHIDLHTSVADNAMILPGVGLNSPDRLLDIGNGIALPTLGPRETFAYLAVHGASSAWFRLKWISDFAALLANASGSEIEDLYRRSLGLGAGRAPGQALLLADRLFATLQNNPALKAELLADRAIHRLYRAALKQLAGRSEPIEPTSTRLGTMRIHWTQFLLLPGLHFKISELARQARSALA